MSKKLWSDERIDLVFDLTRRDIYEISMVEHDEARRVLREMRDDYEQNIEQLETENERLHAQQSGEISELVKANRESIDALHELFDLRAENERLHALLESLTPGGSEFSGNPDRCVEWARQLLSTTGKLAAEKNRLRTLVEMLGGEK